MENNNNNLANNSEGVDYNSTNLTGEGTNAATPRKRARINIPSNDNLGLLSDPNKHLNIAQGSVEGVSDALYEIVSKYKLNKDNKISKDDWCKFMATLQSFNELPDYSFEYQDEDFANWNVPEIFANLIFPLRVTCGAGDGFPNLINRDVYFTTEEQSDEYQDAMNHAEWNIFMQKLAAQIKRDSLPMVSLSKILTRVDYAEAITKFVEDGKVHFNLGEESKFYWPVHPEVKLWNPIDLNTNIVQYIVYRFQVNWMKLMKKDSKQ